MSDPDISRRRPWLAAALALLVSGLGHAYLRRWARAFGWYAVVTATLVFLVPDGAIDQLVAGDRPPIGALAPALVAVGASVVDAYVLAVRNNRARERQAASTDAAPDASESSRDEATQDGDEPDSSGPGDSTVSCPHCGRDTDAKLEFCQWCADPLEP
ncbi:DUF7575 domain-containing protein [Halorubrum sp. FL23]|uniref:DUF7575 domain-containing protein n=1 Tax=Halorubrum sp. FL23 TaxID=3458704 RepID=UPI004034BF89